MKIRIDVASHRAWVGGGINESSESLYGQIYLDSPEACLCLQVPFKPPCLSKVPMILNFKTDPG